MDPTVLIGGELNDTGTTSHLGRGRYLVAEVDEFDGTISLLEPYLALVTNVDNDHLDRYGGRMDNLMAAFRRFMEKVRPGGTVVACLDSPYLVRALAGFRGPLITYSLHDQAGPDGGADYTARAIEFSPSGTRFRVHHGKVSVGEVFLRVPGVHNVQNALGAIAASLYLGVPFGVAAQALAAFRGVQRRLQILGEAGGVRVVDDYAHHPTELKATLQAARIWAGAGRLVCLFQPHRYTRTQLLHREFGPALALADLVGVTDIYPAAEPVIPGVTGELVAQAARDQGKEVPFLKDGDQTLAWLREQVRPGDLVLVVGAGDVWQLGIRLLEELRGDPSATSAMAATSGTHP
ncbi:MAG TPA: UDP-N-acetylmuramate--L-alanine ligase [Firmicutes bacterium]|nr:UDP-N-acetylmuramate--L-alanine ligase [Bacillota bacterium]